MVKINTNYFSYLKNFEGKLVPAGKGYDAKGRKILYYDHIVGDDIIIEAHKTKDFYKEKYDVKMTDEFETRIFDFASKLADDIIESAIEDERRYYFYSQFMDDLMEQQDFYDMVYSFIKENYRVVNLEVRHEVEKKIYDIIEDIINLSQDIIYDMIPY